MQMRLKNDFTSVDRFQTGIGLNYEPSKYFNLGSSIPMRQRVGSVLAIVPT